MHTPIRFYLPPDTGFFVHKKCPPRKTRGSSLTGIALMLPATPEWRVV